MLTENLHVSGEHGERYTKCARTGYNTPPPTPTNPTDILHKGYEIGEEEVKISLDDFRRNYSDPVSGPESVFPPLPPHASSHGANNTTLTHRPAARK